MWQRFIEFLGFWSKEISNEELFAAPRALEVQEDEELVSSEGVQSSLEVEEPGEAVVVSVEDEADEGSFKVGDYVQLVGDSAEELVADGLPTTGKIIAIYRHHAPAAKIIVTLDGVPRVVRVSTYDWKINGETLRLTPRGAQLRRQEALVKREMTNALRRQYNWSEIISSEQEGVARATGALLAEAEGNMEHVATLGFRVLPKGYSHVNDPTLYSAP